LVIMNLRHSYLMCPPEHFQVAYAINPWMDPDVPVDPELAGKQWRGLREALAELGHTVRELDPVPGLPDLVYAANGGFALDGIAYGARFRHPQRTGEAAVYRRWYQRNGWRYVAPTAVAEGEGDLIWTGGMILAGSGFRTEPAAHLEVQETFGYPVISLRLVDPRFYHLDTALAVLSDTARPAARLASADRSGPAPPRIAYFPGAFAPASQRTLRRLFPDALIADETDAAAFGLNLVSDGRHAVLNAEASGMAGKLATAGYTPVPVELSELRKGGGSVKCCVQELRGPSIG
jgi:N-dimethylarginine dimethylaminohydrolase